MDGDEDDFDDLFNQHQFLEDSSQESFTTATSNISFPDECLGDYDSQTSTHSQPSAASTVVQHGDAAGCTNNRQNADSSQYSAIDDLGGLASEQSSQGPIPWNGSTVIDSIEAVFERIADGLLGDGDQVEVQLRSRPVVTASASRASAPLRKYQFPGKTADEAWRFTMVVRILELMHQALRENKVMSKRDIFYRDPALFGNQTRVDKYVDDIAFTLGVTRSQLNVTAAAKGLVAGALRFCLRNGSTLDASGNREGMLVPAQHDLLSADLSAVRWILVIEKEATFRSIAASSYWETISSRGVIVTGKGYPDISTRSLLHFLSNASPRNGFAAPPVYGLADFDPDGLAILSTYKYGSVALAHENAHICVPQLKWIGLRGDHMPVEVDGGHAAQGLLRLTAGDRKKAMLMLARGGDQTMMDALRTMLMLNLKAELQMLDAMPKGHGLEDLLRLELP